MQIEEEKDPWKGRQISEEDRIRTEQYNQVNPFVYPYDRVSVFPTG